MNKWKMSFNSALLASPLQLALMLMHINAPVCNKTEMPFSVIHFVHSFTLGHDLC